MADPWYERLTRGIFGGSAAIAAEPPPPRPIHRQAPREGFAPAELIRHQSSAAVGVRIAANDLYVLEAERGGDRHRTVIELGPRSEIDRAVRGALMSADSGGGLDQLQPLADKFVDAIDGSRIVSVDGNGALAGVPWGALAAQRGLIASGAAIETVMFDASFARGARKFASGKQAAAFAAPDPGAGDDLTPYLALENASREARKVAALYDAKPMISTGQKQPARKFRQLAASNPKVLHVGAHADYFDLREIRQHQEDARWAAAFAKFVPTMEELAALEDPRQRSRILLGGFNQYLAGDRSLRLADVSVSAAEIEAMDLSGIELVTLGICRAGWAIDDEAASATLSGAFVRAGARAVVASGWSIPDAPTEKFMTQFHARFSDGDPVGVALWTAQRALRCAGEAASTWGAFSTTTQAGGATATSQRAVDRLVAEIKS